MLVCVWAVEQSERKVKGFFLLILQNCFQRSIFSGGGYVWEPIGAEPHKKEA